VLGVKVTLRSAPYGYRMTNIIGATQGPIAEAGQILGDGARAEPGRFNRLVVKSANAGRCTERSPSQKLAWRWSSEQRTEQAVGGGMFKGRMSEPGARHPCCEANRGIGERGITPSTTDTQCPDMVATDPTTIHGLSSVGRYIVRVHSAKFGLKPIKLHVACSH